MPAFYINTYMPLVGSKAGREAAATHRLPPFIDGSIRREPDLEHKYPAISCLCRAGKFVPRLRVDDIVAYLTKKGTYGSGTKQRRLVAILCISNIFDSHHEAAQWYRAKRFLLPSNCMVQGNPPQPLDQSHRIFQGSKCSGDARTHRAWDAVYRERVRQHKSFVVCKALFRDLSWDAPFVTDEILINTLGCIPATQNPGQLTMRDYKNLLSQLRLRISR